MGKPDTLSRKADHGIRTGDNSDITLLTPKFFAVCVMEIVEITGAEVNILHDICKGPKCPMQEEPVAKAIQEL